MSLPRMINKKGFTLIETLIALGIFSFVATGVLSFSTWIIRSVMTESLKVERNVENLEMLKLFTQPLYFGAMSQYPENSHLRSCMTADSVNCDSTKVYSITPYDLATHKPLISASDVKSTAIKSEVSFQVQCPKNETTCDKAEYYSVTVKTYLEYQGVAFSKVQKKGIVSPVFKNVVTYVPDAVLAPGRPINIIVFLDTSNSMASAKDQVMGALDSLLGKISKMDATLAIYPLSLTYEPVGGDYYVYDISGNKTPLDTIYGHPPGFEYYRDVDIAPWYTATYSGQAPHETFPWYRVFNFLATDTDAIKTTKISAVKGLIESLFQNDTWPVDVPMCNMLRLLEKPGALSPFKFDPMTPTAVFMISNEDDETGPGNSAERSCEGMYSVKYEVAVPFTHYHYDIKRQTHFVKLEVTGTMDGAPKIINMDLDYYLPYDATKVHGSDCTALVNAIPAEEFEAIFLEWFERTWTIWNYKSGDGVKIKGCTVSNNEQIEISGPHKTPQSICQDIADGKYTVPSSYITNSCSERIYVSPDSGAYAWAYNPRFMIPDTSTAVETLYNSIKAKLNLDNFYYTAIVHPNNTACTMTPGSQVGTHYVELANKPGIQSSVIPVCSGDYSAQLDKIVQWTETLGANDIELTAFVAANFSGAEILRSETTLKLIKGQDYQLTGNVLAFRAGLLQPNDVIKVYLN